MFEQLTVLLVVGGPGRDGFDLHEAKTREKGKV
jgi:hypothetical protein